MFLCEFAGTALLLAAGLSAVVLDFAPGSPVPRLLPHPALRRALTGLLFGGSGALVALSPLGKLSGAHINPVVTLSFWLMGKMRTAVAAGYVAAQLAGGAAGTAALLAWGPLARSVHFGATIPGAGYGVLSALGGEAAATFLMVVLLLSFVGNRRLRPFTPLLFPLLYAFLVLVEAPVSGTSTNPARSFGPALLSGQWREWWVYWLGPLSGALAAVAVHRSRLLGALELEIAKLYHFEHDLYRELRHEPQGWRRRDGEPG